MCASLQLIYRKLSLGTAIASAAFFAALPAGYSQDTMPEDLGQEPVAEWLSRIDGSVYIDKDGAIGEIETIQPLFRTPDFSHTFFTQGRAAYDDEKWTFNGGIGYRYLMPSKTWILGVNAFADMETDQYHKRISAGFEAIGEQLTIRSNLYKGVTDWKTLSETTTTKTETKPVDGFDFALEGPVPHMPWLRAEATYFKWTPDVAKDIDGFRGKLTAQLTKSISLEGGYQHTNNDDRVFGRLTFALGAPEDHEFTAQEDFFTEQMFVARDLTKQTLQKVERSNEIVLEKRVTNKATATVSSGGVSITRGS
jgi:hypothetical protein